MNEIKFTDIHGIQLGHAQNLEGCTGCSVVICKEGASGGVDVRGGSPGTRETDLLNPMELVDKVHAVVLSGGSAFGLDASAGVMEYLEKNSIGFDVGVTKVPIVCSAVLFDLVIGSSDIRPDKLMGLQACINSEEYKGDINGNIGAGTGATVGKFKGPEFSMKGGLGTYAVQVGDLQVGAIVAVNALGDIVDTETNTIIAGALSDDKKTFVNTEDFMISQYDKSKNVFSGNTTIGVVVTNAILTKAQANKVASMSHNGYGRAIRPAHTMFDGDTIFALSTNKVNADINVVGLLAAQVMEKAIVRGIKEANSVHGLISYKEFNK
ncbi:P1 family peptidase [Clostridium sp. 'White wine YQ']|uniref:P1 family peptidase n=1 Tax=Clostridium sp. 'White wine YQ' TaxID=3027474 RepID=UPI0023655A42|nr:P1 family peptidase [Clostridium sp. 'White wine YQ']MDD7792946.1 P1 family peptidase [Clostridium sp. 'White wine YQ']